MPALYMPLTGIIPGSPRPSHLVEVRFAVGSPGATQGPKKVLILAPSLASGDITQDTQLFGPVASEDEVIARTGSGSVAHLTWAAYRENGGTLPTYLLCPTRSVGVAATGTVTITGTPTGRGTAFLTAAAISVAFVFDVGDTPTTIAAGLRDAWNAKTRNPIVATNTAGVLTLTAKQTGLGGNTLRFKTSSTGQGIALTGAAEAPLSGGTVAENHTAALATIAGQRFSLIVAATSDATEMGRIKTHVDSLALPAAGLRQFVAFGTSLTPSAASTASQTLNMARASWLNQEESPEPSYAIAGTWGGIIASNYPANPSKSLNGFGLKEGQATTLKKPTNSTAVPNATEVDLMLNSGVTPVNVSPADIPYIERSVTTRSHNGSLVADYRVRDTHRVWVADALGDDIQARLALQNWEGLTDDPADENADQPAAKFGTPRRARAVVEPVVRGYFAKGHLDPAAEARTFDEMQIGLDTDDAGVLNVFVPDYAMILFKGTRTLIAERSPSA